MLTYAHDDFTSANADSTSATADFTSSNADFTSPIKFLIMYFKLYSEFI